MPALDYRALAEGLANVHYREIGQNLAREASDFVVRSEVISTIVKRSVDHRALEALGVILTCVFGVGGYMFYAIKYQS